MPNISELKESKFITKNDVNPPAQFTIDTCEQVNVAKEGASPEIKWALNLLEIEKPFILNSTNAQIIAKFTGSDEMDDWKGKKVVLYYDPNVSFAGKLTGGIRVRSPRNPAPPGPPGVAKAAAAAAPGDADQDVPF